MQRQKELGVPTKGGPKASHGAGRRATGNDKSNQSPGKKKCGKGVGRKSTTTCRTHRKSPNGDNRSDIHKQSLSEPTIMGH
eukprot:scaffold16886_cov148-Skeletonema_menzelii.AAC.1